MRVTICKLAGILELNGKPKCTFTTWMVNHGHFFKAVWLKISLRSLYFRFSGVWRPHRFFPDDGSLLQLSSSQCDHKATLQAVFEVYKSSLRVTKGPRGGQLFQPFCCHLGIHSGAVPSVSSPRESASHQCQVVSSVDRTVLRYPSSCEYSDWMHEHID